MSGRSAGTGGIQQRGTRPTIMGWESADFPIVCETCLGENPYVRMMRNEYGDTCRICERPFTVFRWKPGGKETRFKRTEICQTCAKMKNVCQTCLFDLQYGLPVGVRDAELGIAQDELPESTVGKEYQANQWDKLSGQKQLQSMYSKAPTETLRKLARRAPQYQRNRPHICSFFVKGTCNRGKTCPYRHELPKPSDHPLSQQDIQSRYYGKGDVLADAMLENVKGLDAGKDASQPPADQSVKTLYLSGVPGAISETDLRLKFGEYGAVHTVRVLRTRECAFVEFVERRVAEIAAGACAENLFVKGRRLQLRWATPRRSHVPAVAPVAAPVGPVGVDSFFMMPPAPPGAVAEKKKGGVVMPPPPPGGLVAAPTTAYPSMNPARMGSGKKKVMPPPPP